MAKPLNSRADRDLELLSTYLDGELDPRDRAALDRRLAREPELRAALSDLRGTRAMLRALPRLKAPRDFTLDPAVYGQRAPWWRRLLVVENLLQLGGALGTAASVVLIVLAVAFSAVERGDDRDASGVALVFSPTAPLETAPSTVTMPTARAPLGTIEAPAAAEGAVNGIESAREGADDDAERMDDGPAMPDAEDTTSLMAPPPAALQAGTAEDAFRDAPPGESAAALGGQPEAWPEEVPSDTGAELFFDGTGVAEDPAAAGTEFETEAARAAPEGPLPSPLPDEVAQAAPKAADGAPDADDSGLEGTGAVDRQELWWLVGIGAATLAVSLALWVVGWRKARRT